jgi:hypothetical protein
VSTKAYDLTVVRYNPVRLAGHAESYFLNLRDPSGERGLALEASVFASESEPLRPLAEGWATTFDRRGGQRRHVAVKHTIPFEAASFSRRGLGVGWKLPASIGLEDSPAELTITPGESAGRIGAPDHQIQWNLRFSAQSAPLAHYPFPAMYDGPLPAFKLCSPLPDERFDGELTVDGERWSIEGWRGMVGHSWGKAPPERYARACCASWDEGDDLLLDGMSAKLALGPLSTPLVSFLCVRHQGVDYAFNQPLQLVRGSAEIGARRWEFAAKSDGAQIEGSVEAIDDDFVGLYRPTPDGRMSFALTTQLAAARVRFQPKGGALVERSSRSAGLEIGTYDPGHGVRMYV